ncbi:MAG: maleylpyruvate isomerase N-terminal domain-containing protein [Dehalococcoidia bacterium]
MTEDHRQAPLQHGVPDREAIRRELEQAKQDFHALLNSLDPSDWERSSGTRGWTVRQSMWHLASEVGLTAGSVAMAKQGRNYSPPGWLSRRINAFTTGRGARHATVESVAEQYDYGHEKLIAALDEVEPEDWEKGSRIFGEYTTVEGHFHAVARRFAEYSAAIKKTR